MLRSSLVLALAYETCTDLQQNAPGQCHALPTGWDEPCTQLSDKGLVGGSPPQSTPCGQGRKAGENACRVQAQPLFLCGGVFLM